MNLGNVNIDAFDDLFPFYVRFDLSGKIVALGRSLAKILPNEGAGSVLQNIFKFENSQAAGIGQSQPQLQSMVGRILVLEGVTLPLRLKGQIVEWGEGLCFVGSPMAQSADELFAVGLEMVDFALHDQVTELLIQVQSQRMALSEAKDLSNSLKRKNERLVASEAGLKIASANLEVQLNRVQCLNAFSLNASKCTVHSSLVELAQENLAKVLSGYKILFEPAQANGQFLPASDDVTSTLSIPNDRSNPELGVKTKQFLVTSNEKTLARLVIEAEPNLAKQAEEEAALTTFLELFLRTFEALWINLDFVKNLELLVEEKTRNLSSALVKLEESKGKIQLVLDNLEQGILTIDEQFLIVGEYSPYLFKLLNMDSQSALRQPVFEGIFESWLASNNSKNQTIEALRAGFGESLLAWDMNCHHLPKEIELESGAGEKLIVSLQWTPVLNSQTDTTERVLIAIRDCTEQRRLEKMAEDEKKHSDRMSQMIKELAKFSREKLEGNLSTLGNRLDSIKDRLLEADSGPSLFRELHTVKGECRSYGFEYLSEDVHDAETACKDFLAPTGNQDLSKKKLEDSIALVERVFGEYKKLAVELLGIRFGESAQAVTEVSFELLASEGVKSLKTLLSQFSIPLKSLVVKDAVIKWPPKSFDFLRTFFLHGLTNSADHGFIQANYRGPDERGAEIQIEANLEGNQVKISISDNGKGISLEKVSQKSGISIAELSNPDRLCEVLTMDGFSTSKTVTMTSGRGVGLAAVVVAAQAFGGYCQIASRQSGGVKMSAVLDITKLSS